MSLFNNVQIITKTNLINIFHTSAKPGLSLRSKCMSIVFESKILNVSTFVCVMQSQRTDMKTVKNVKNSKQEASIFWAVMKH